MSGPFGSSQWMYNAGSSFYPVQINDSLRFEDGSSAYLTRTPTTAGNQQTWTWSGWVKRGNLGNNYFTLFSAKDASLGNYLWIQYTSSNDDELQIYQYPVGNLELTTTGVFLSLIHI